MRSALVEAYRVPPDRRFLIAVGDIHRLLTGHPRSVPTVVFRDGRWHIGYAEAEVGSVSPFPDFPEILAVLIDWARRVPMGESQSMPPGEIAALRAQVGERIDRLAVRELLGVLRQLDQVWNSGKRDPSLFPLGARATVLLNLQLLDRVEMGDPMMAKALALLALTRGRTTDPALREEALLAHSMDYGKHAKRIAAGLPESDPARSFLMGNADSLKQAALAPSASRETRYLWLLQLSDAQAERELYVFNWAHFRSPELALSGLKAALELGTFTANRAVPPQIPRAVLDELSGELGSSVEGWRGNLARAARFVVGAVLEAIEEIAAKFPGKGAGQTRADDNDGVATAASAFIGFLEPSLGFLIDRFEWGSEKAARKHSGPFLDPETYRAYYRAFFYSGLMARGIFYLDKLSSIEAAQEYAGELEAAKAGQAVELARWYRHLAEAKAGKESGPILGADLSSLPRLGPPFLMRSIEELQEVLPYGSPGAFIAARRFVARLDTRVEHRLHFSWVAFRMLMDLRLVEDLDRAAVDASTLEGLAVRFAEFVGDRKRLTEMLRAPDVSVEGKAVALHALEKQGESPRDFLKAEYRRLLAEKSDSLNLRWGYTGYLERIKEYGAARAVISEWLEENEEKALGLEAAVARTKLARLYEKEGDYRAAWDAIAPAIESWQRGVLAQAASLLDKLGHPEKAEELARQMVSRYPDSPEGRADLAGLYWRHGKPVEAARLLTRAPRALSGEDWKFKVTPKFAEAFTGNHDGALSAFVELIATGTDPFAIKYLIQAMSEAGMHDTAFQMASQIRWPGQGGVEFNTIAYQNLREVKGREAALAWLRPRVPANILNRASMVVFEVKRYELLWDLIEHPEGDMADFVWVTRAAAAVRTGLAKDPNRGRLLEYYRRPVPGHYHVIGRFLLGLATEDEVLAQATDANRRCEVAFFIGLKAQAEGRYRDASDWYRVTVETSVSNYVEYRWAYHTLYTWLGPYKSLSRLDTEKF
jgi:tetratricopeptide (TPR) repeat protein